MDLIALYGYGTLIRLVLALAGAGVVTFFMTPLVRLFAVRLGAMDVPGEARRVHDHPIPRMGGLAIVFGFLLAVILFAQVDGQIRGILLGGVVVAVVGIIDDIRSLPALLKFCVQIAAALVAVLHGVAIEIISNPNVFSAREFVGLDILSVPVTVLWIVAITNSVNLIDGLDGLAVGVSAIASVTMLVIALAVGQANVALVLAALTGACLGFMPYNLNPAKIFMGDTGALFLGFVLACVSVVGFLKLYAVISFAVPVLALGLPLFDTTFAVFRRLSHGQNPMAPDRGHIHHRLIDMGLSQKQAVAVMYTVSTMLGLSAVVLATSGELRALILICAFFAAVMIGTPAVKSMARHPAPPEETPAPEPPAPEPEDTPTQTPSGPQPPAL